MDILEKWKAVADPTRFKILALLVEGELCVCELEDKLGVSQPRVSQALLKLKNAGLITMRVEGRWKYYSISKQGRLFLKKSPYQILQQEKKGRRKAGFRGKNDGRKC